MKTVLIVDDEKLFLVSLTEGLQTYSDEFAVVTAANGREAVKILHTQEIALVITDLKMPVMDGFQLLAFMMQSKPEIPVIVMTAFGTPEIEESIMNFDACGYLEKPIDFQVLTDKIRAVIKEPEAHSSGITLTSFINLLHTEHRTCSLFIKSQGQSGTLSFFEGQLVDADFDNQVGEAAALEIVTWTDVEIEITKTSKKSECRIEKPLQQILLEAAQAKQDKPVALAAAKTAEPTASPSNKEIVQQKVGKSKSDDSEVVSPTINQENTPRKETNLAMASNLNQSIQELMSIDGALAVALVDSNSGMALGTAGNSINLDVAAAGNSEVIKSKNKVMQNLGLKDKIEDILISLGSQYHLIRPLSNHNHIFFYLVLDRAKSNLAMARFKLSDVETRVEL